MTDMLVQHLLITTLLAMLVGVLCALFRPRPAVRHALWTIVMLKLMIPPVGAWPVAVPATWQPSLSESKALITNETFEARAPQVTVMAEPSLIVNDVEAPVAEVAVIPEIQSDPAHMSQVAPELEPKLTESALPSVEETDSTPVMAWTQPSGPAAGDAVQPVAPVASSFPAIDWTVAGLFVWIVGAIGIAALQLLRWRRFERMTASTAIAPPWLEEIGESIARQFDVRTPAVLVCEKLTTPVMAGVLRPRLIVPAHLIGRLDRERWRPLLAHELAHLKRRDHWTRALEFVCGVVWFWDPVFWAARRAARTHAELACDAWVVQTLPDARRAYADSLLDVSEFANGDRLPVTAIGMSTVTHAKFEKRLTMILRDEVDHRLPIRALAAAAVLVALTLPGFAVQPEAAPAVTPPPSDDVKVPESVTDPVAPPPAHSQAAAELRASSANNLKQIGLSMKMFANESPGQGFPRLSRTPGQLAPDTSEIFPEFLADPLVFLSPAHPNRKAVAERDPASLIGDHSYWYLGYMIPDEATGIAFLEQFRAQTLKGERPAGVFETELKNIQPLREGVERFLITDINDSDAISKLSSTIPIMIERPGMHDLGANVLYLDGHVEFLKYPGEFPMTEGFIEGLRSLDALKSESSLFASVTTPTQRPIPAVAPVTEAVPMPTPVPTAQPAPVRPEAPAPTPLAVTQAPMPEPTPSPLPRPARPPISERMREVLDSPVSMEFENEFLANILGFIAEYTDMTIVLDQRVVGDPKVSASASPAAAMKTVHVGPHWFIKPERKHLGTAAWPRSFASDGMIGPFKSEVHSVLELLDALLLEAGMTYALTPLGLWITVPQAQFEVQNAKLEPDKWIWAPIENQLGSLRDAAASGLPPDLNYLETVKSLSKFSVLSARLESPIQVDIKRQHVVMLPQFLAETLENYIPSLVESGEDDKASGGFQKPDGEKEVAEFVERMVPRTIVDAVAIAPPDGDAFPDSCLLANDKDRMQALRDLAGEPKSVGADDAMVVTNGSVAFIKLKDVPLQGALTALLRPLHLTYLTGPDYIFVTSEAVAESVDLTDPRIAAGQEDWAQKLDAPVSIEFEDLHLSGIATFISDYQDLNIVLDTRVVKPAGTPSDPRHTYVTDGMVPLIKVENVRLADALKLLLIPLNLTYTIGPGYIWVSTPELIAAEPFDVSNQTSTDNDTSVTVSLQLTTEDGGPDGGGQIFLDGEAVTTWHELEDRLADIRSTGPNVTLMVATDQRLPADRFEAVMEYARKAKIDMAHIMIRENEQEVPKADEPLVQDVPPTGTTSTKRGGNSSPSTVESAPTESPVWVSAVFVSAAHSDMDIGADGNTTREVQVFGRDALAALELEMAKLNDPISLDLRDVHISEVMQTLSEREKFNVVFPSGLVRPVDEKHAVQDANYVSDGMIPYVKLESVRLRDAFTALLEPLGLSWRLEPTSAVEADSPDEAERLFSKLRVLSIKPWKGEEFAAEVRSEGMDRSRWYRNGFMFEHYEVALIDHIGQRVFFYYEEDREKVYAVGVSGGSKRVDGS